MWSTNNLENTHTHTTTHTQTHRHKHTHTHTHTHRGTHTHTERDTHTHKDTHKQTHRDTHSLIHGVTNPDTNIQSQLFRLTDLDRQKHQPETHEDKDRPTYRGTHSHTRRPVRRTSWDYLNHKKLVPIFIQHVKNSLPSTCTAQLTHMMTS